MESSPVLRNNTKMSVLAVLSLIFGVLGVVSFGSLIAVVLGHLARSEIKQGNGSLEGDGLAKAGLILGYIMLLLSLVALVLFITLRGFLLSLF